jgi:hypothetical protein
MAIQLSHIATSLNFSQSYAYGHLKMDVSSLNVPFEGDSGLTPSMLCIRHRRGTGFSGLHFFYVEDQLKRCVLPL